MGVRAAGLCAAKVRTAQAGRYGDGDGLYLTVRSNASAFWVFRYTIGKMREMGLGRARGQNAVTLAEARTKAGELHRLVRTGADPLTERAVAKAAALAASQQSIIAARTFRQAAQDYLSSKGAEWSNTKHSKQWPNTLETYVYPHFGDLPVTAITTAHVLAAVKPIWTTKTETASRVRGRIEKILDAEKAAGRRQGENPALWKGHLAMLLPSPGKISAPQHHPALPYDNAPAFYRALEAQEGVGARALEFTILTAARSGMTILATWAEIDFNTATWSVPGEHMKGGKPFRIPLSQQAVTALRNMERLRETDDGSCFIFPGASDGHISEATMTAVLTRMKQDDASVHGFRSTFRDWIAECTEVPNEVAEKCLAHFIGSKVEAAYRRGELFRKRREAMELWGAHCVSRERPSAQAA